MFRVILHKKAAKAVRDLPPRDLSRIISALREMEDGLAPVAKGEKVRRIGTKAFMPRG